MKRKNPMFDQTIATLTKHLAHKDQPHPAPLNNTGFPVAVPRRPGFEAKDAEDEDFPLLAEEHLRSGLAGLHRYYQTSEHRDLLEARAHFAEASLGKDWSRFEKTEARLIRKILADVEAGDGKEYDDATFATLVDAVITVETFLANTARIGASMPHAEHMMEALLAAQAYLRIGDRTRLYDAQDHVHKACHQDYSPTESEEDAFALFEISLKTLDSRPRSCGPLDLRQLSCAVARVEHVLHTRDRLGAAVQAAERALHTNSLSLLSIARELVARVESGCCDAEILTATGRFLDTTKALAAIGFPRRRAYRDRVFVDCVERVETSVEILATYAQEQPESPGWRPPAI